MLNNFKTKEPSDKDWQRFVKEGLTDWTDENPINVKYEFTKMSKIFGLSYIYWLECQYKCIENEDNFEEKLNEIAKWNGGVPLKFFDKFKNNNKVISYE